MQNPFRSQSHNDVGGHHDDSRWDPRDARHDERPTWTEGDGGRTAQAWSGQGRDASGRDHRSPHEQGYQSRRQDRGEEQYGYGQQSLNRGWIDDRGESGSAGSHSGPSGGGYSRGGGFGGSSMRDQGGDQRYPTHGYAPGAQIWEGSGPGMGGQSHEHHDFEPDYLHWREQQLSAFDKDYRSWRDERRQKFSSDFDTWRQSRPRTEASGDHRTQAENPIVGDVTDGGVGSAADARKG